MQNNYKVPFVNKAEVAINEQDTVLVVDEDTGSKFTSFIFKGTYNTRALSASARSRMGAMIRFGFSRAITNPVLSTRCILF